MQINSTIFKNFPVLQTDRLTLREIRLSDAEKIFEMRASKRVNQFIARPDMTKEEHAMDLTKKTMDAFEKGAGIGWAGILRDGNHIIGTCGFNYIDYPNLRAEIGGELSTQYWGKNLALEAVSAITEFGFSKMNLHSIEAKLSPENRGAIFILEALGFKKEAHFKDRIFFNNRFSDMVVYSLVK